MNGWIDTIDLVTVTEETINENGFPVSETETKTTVYANIKAVSRTEFYQANAAKINVVCVAEVKLFEYNDEKLVDYNGKRYVVARTYPDRKREIVELTLSENE